MAKQIKSRERVTEHGEVFTAERENDGGEKKFLFPGAFTSGFLSL